jgi:hypothetical protein
MANKDKNIQDRLKGNTEKFDQHELPLNHRELFESKLDSHFNHNNEDEDNSSSLESNSNSKEEQGRVILMPSFSNLQKYAAVFIVAVGILSSIYMIGLDSNSNVNISGDLLADTNVETMEEKYSVEVREALVPFREKGQKLSPEYRAFLKQLDKLDRENEKIKKLMQENPEDEKLMQDLIDNFKTRLEVLEKIKKIISNNKMNLN